MEAREMDRTRKGIWYVAGSMPLLSEMLMLMLDRLHRLTLLVILLLDVLIVAASFACAALLVPREQAMVIGTRHCIEYNLSGQDGEDVWFQSWRIDEEETVCARVQPNAPDEHNRELFKRFFRDGKLHTSFQMPVRRNRSLSPFQRANRYLKGYLSVLLDISNNATGSSSDVTMQLRLGGRDGGGRQAEWHQLGRAVTPLDLDTCERRTEQSEDGAESERCVVNQRLFELPALDHQFYLLNARIQNMTQPALSMNLLVIHQSRPYTLVCLGVQACCGGLLLLLLALFLLRVVRLYRAPPTGHSLLAALAGTLIVWDVPLGYIALDYPMPWLGIVDALRLDLFYWAFLSFCLVFVCERAFVKGGRRPLRRWVPALTPLLAGCLLLLALDVSQQCLQLSAVFSPRPGWLRFCLAALLVLNALFVLLLCAAALRSGRRLAGRYRALLAGTCLTAAAACAEHAERRESDNYWFWSWTEQRPTDGHLLFIGMVVWYNVFVATLLVLYLPTRPLVEVAYPLYEDEQKKPLNGGDEPEPIRRAAAGQ